MAFIAPAYNSETFVIIVKFTVIPQMDSGSAGHQVFRHKKAPFEGDIVLSLLGNSPGRHSDAPKVSLHFQRTPIGDSIGWSWVPFRRPT